MNYHRQYRQLIFRAVIRGRLTDYCERHHVVPKCLGGSDHYTNLVWLTPEEHYVAHLLLVKMNPGNVKLVYAALMMTAKGTGHRRSNKLYGWIKRKVSEARKGKPFSPEHIAKLKAAQLGRKRGPQSEEHRRRISESQKGRQVPRERVESQRLKLLGRRNGPHSEEAKKKMSQAKMGHPVSEGTRAKLRAAMLGTKRGPYQISEESRRLKSINIRKALADRRASLKGG